MSNPEQFERIFVELVVQRAEKKGFNKSEFARKVWPEAHPKSSAAKWAAIRGRVSKTGNPQGVLLSDAMRMASILDEDVTYLIACAKYLSEQSPDK